MTGRIIITAEKVPEAMREEYAGGSALSIDSQLRGVTSHDRMCLALSLLEHLDFTLKEALTLAMLLDDKEGKMHSSTKVVLDMPRKGAGE